MACKQRGETTKGIWIVLGCIAIVWFFWSACVYADGKISLPIHFQENLHYICDPYYPEDNIVLYCMNNKRHWPHDTPSLGGVSVPRYVEGYLTPEHFKSQEEYEDCMRRLAKILYAGYPFNGEKLYKIVEKEETQTLTVEEFDEMLIADPRLLRDFECLRGYAFSYNDWMNHNETNVKALTKFIKEVKKLHPNRQTESGLTYNDIIAMPFYKAAVCLVSAHKETPPLELFVIFYPDAYMVTKEQAYDATQKAVWRLLNAYDIEDNDISGLDKNGLEMVLYQYAENGKILNKEPQLTDIRVSGDFRFTYDARNNVWRSGMVRVVEDDKLNGIYRLLLPEGMRVEQNGANYIYGNEEYYLVSDQKPTSNEEIGIEADFVWLKDVRQYAPEKEIEVAGKKFQNMVGAVVRNAKFSKRYPLQVQEMRDLTIVKTVEGEAGDLTKEFPFEISLVDVNGQPINGECYYVIEEEGRKKEGWLSFEKGVSNISLKNGEKITIYYLPWKSKYRVQELLSEAEDYDTTYNEEKKVAEGILYQNELIHVINRKEFIPDTGVEEPPRSSAILILTLLIGTSSLFLFLDGLHKRKGRRR